MSDRERADRASEPSEFADPSTSPLAAHAAGITDSSQVAAPAPGSPRIREPRSEPAPAPSYDDPSVSPLEARSHHDPADRELPPRTIWERTAATVMPGTVRWGLGIQWLGVVVGAVSVVLALAGFAGTEASVGAGRAGQVLLLVGATAAIVVLQAVVLFVAGRGHNWARIVLLVLCALGLVRAFFAGGGPSIGDLLSIVSVVLLFLPPSNEWYRVMSGAR